MSYDLCFWSERPGADLDGQAVYEDLLAGKTVEGLLPVAVEDYLLALAQVFPDGTREPNGPYEWFVWESARDMFEVQWSAVHVLVTMRPLNGDNANRLIDIAASFGLSLYDPQTGERFAFDGN